MAGNLFREKSMEKVTSPEQMNDYIKIAGPGVCLVMAAVLVFLACLWIWAAAGTLDMTVESWGIGDGSILYCYLDEEEIQYVQEGMPVRTSRGEGTVMDAARIPDDYGMMAERMGGEGMVHALRIPNNAWRYLVTISMDISGEDRTSQEDSVSEEDGISEEVTEVSIVTGQISPLAYIFNREAAK